MCSDFILLIQGGQCLVDTFPALSDVVQRAVQEDFSLPDEENAACQRFDILLQLFWLFALIALGRLLERFALKKVIVQGG